MPPATVCALIDVHGWPLTIGRALDNDVVLPDPHVAAHHATLAPDADGQGALTVGDSRNGVRIELGPQPVAAASPRAAAPARRGSAASGPQSAAAAPADDPLPAELPLRHGAATGSRWLVPALALVALVWLLAHTLDRQRRRHQVERVPGAGAGQRRAAARVVPGVGPGLEDLHRSLHADAAPAAGTGVRPDAAGDLTCR